MFNLIRLPSFPLYDTKVLSIMPPSSDGHTNGPPSFTTQSKSSHRHSNPYVRSSRHRREQQSIYTIGRKSASWTTSKLTPENNSRHSFAELRYTWSTELTTTLTMKRTLDLDIQFSRHWREQQSTIRLGRKSASWMTLHHTPVNNSRYVSAGNTTSGVREDRIMHKSII